jgi:hypothetical protein
MSPYTKKWLADLRLQALDPGTLFVAIRSRAGRLLLYPEDILDKSDEQLLDLIRDRLAGID